MEPERITARQIEAARRAITRVTSNVRAGCDPDFPGPAPVSSKPAEVRMGSGKGAPEFWVAPGSSPAVSCSSWTGFPAISPRRRSSGRRKAADQDQRVVARGARAWPRGKVKWPPRTISRSRPTTAVRTACRAKREQSTCASSRPRTSWRSRAACVKFAAALRRSRRCRPNVPAPKRPRAEEDLRCQSASHRHRGVRQG